MTRKGRHAAEQPEEAAMPDSPEVDEVQTAEEADVAELGTGESTDAASGVAGAGDAESGTAAEAAPPELTAEERIVDLESRLAAAEDARLRALADAENVRRRSERARADSIRFGGVPLARDLLDVHDSLDRLTGMIDEALRESAPSFVEGVELIRRQLATAFGKHKIEQICPEKGDPLNPNLHQSMFNEIDEEVEPGNIVRVLQTGFQLDDRLLRPATVSLSDKIPVRAKSKPAAKTKKAKASKDAPVSAESESTASDSSPDASAETADESGSAGEKSGTTG